MIAKRFPLTNIQKTVPHKLIYASLVEWFFRQFVQSAEAMAAANYMASCRAMKMALTQHLIRRFSTKHRHGNYPADIIIVMAAQTRGAMSS